MKFSTRAEYGLKAMANLAGCFPAQKNLKNISLEEGVSEKYLERIIGILRDNNLVKSTKGKSGGYALVKKPTSIRVGEIIEILEGPISTMQCGLCQSEKKCATSVVWIKLEKEIRKTLNNIKLGELG